MTDEKTVDADGYEWRSGQEILFAVGLGGGRVLGYEGKNVYLAITNEEMGVDAYWQETGEIFCDREPEVGIYLWVGSIGILFEDGWPSAVEIKGEFSPASPEDIARLMGKYDSLTIEADDY